MTAHAHPTPLEPFMSDPTAPSSNTSDGQVAADLHELWADMPDHDIPLDEEIRLRYSSEAQS